MNDLPIEEKRSWVIALTIGCPMDTKLDVCPAKVLMGQPLTEIVTQVNQMSETELNGIITRHQACLCLREGSPAERKAYSADPTSGNIFQPTGQRK